MALSVPVFHYRRSTPAGLEYRHSHLPPRGLVRETTRRNIGALQALRDRMLLRAGTRPIIGYVGRLDTQKGLHLIRHALFYALEHDAQFVLLGSGSEHGINEDFWHLKRRLNDHPDCHLEIGYDEELAHLIYAGTDFLVMPSLYEPCGLTQMIALRYGAVPVVRTDDRRDVAIPPPCCCACAGRWGWPWACSCWGWLSLGWIYCAPIVAH